MIKLERSLLYLIYTECILYPMAPCIALQLCRINKSLVDNNFFFIFLILLTISFWFSIWKLEKALDNDSQ